METDYDAIIIGAGPAGSSAAILLARSGWRVALVEKQAYPRRKVCGECLAPSNLPLLDAMGIGAALAAVAGPPLREVALMHGSQVIRSAFPPYPDERHRWGVAVGREYLDTLLLDQARLCGATVFQPWVARRIEGETGRFRCHVTKVQVDDQAVLTAPVLIDAHGSWEPAPSPLPDTPTLRQQPHLPSDLFAFKANFTQAGLEPGVLPVLSFAGGYGGMVVGGHNTTTFAFCLRRDMLAYCRKAYPARRAAESAAAYVAHACAGVRAWMQNAQRQGAWLAVGPIQPAIRLRPFRAACRTGFLIGNAAGEAHPIIGEGMSMAIQSAWLLAEKLAPYKAQMSDKALQLSIQNQYVRDWKRQFARRFRLAALFAHLAMRPALAGWLLPVLARYPHMLAHAACWSGKVQCIPVRESFENLLPEINERPAGRSILQDGNQPRSL